MVSPSTIMEMTYSSMLPNKNPVKWGLGFSSSETVLLVVKPHKFAKWAPKWTIEVDVKAKV